MSSDRAELEQEHAKILDQIKILFEANQDFWRAIPMGRLSRQEALKRIAQTTEELIHLAQQEKSIVLQLLVLEDNG
jgi:hypothetical protein